MSKTALRHVRIFDGTGKAAVEDGLLIYETTPQQVRGQILYAGPADAGKEMLRSCDTQADLNGYTVMPGLINCHVHLDLSFPFPAHKVDPFGPAYRALIAYRRLAEVLMSGVTTVRSTGAADYTDVAVRDAVQKNLLFGSRMVASGEIVIAHGGHGYNEPGACECSGPAEFAKGTRAQLMHGVDLIKICMTGGLASPHEGVGDKQMTDAEIDAVVTVAHGSGKPVAAHLSNDLAIRAAVKYGVDSVEHGYFMSRETAALLREKGTYYVPTIAVSHAAEYLIERGSPAYQVRKQAEAEKRHRQALVDAIAERVIIGVGTDLLPNDPLEGTTATIREIECLVESGMTPAQALEAATSVSALICGVAEETGTLAPGMDADFIAVQGKPDQTISDLRRIDMVAKGGRRAFSRVPGFEAPGFNVVAPGYPLGGATTLKW